MHSLEQRAKQLVSRAGFKVSYGSKTECFVVTEEFELFRREDTRYEQLATLVARSNSLRSSCGVSSPRRNPAMKLNEYLKSQINFQANLHAKLRFLK